MFGSRGFSSRTQIHEHPAYGRVLEIELIGSEGEERPFPGTKVIQEEVARHRPQYLVINLLEFERPFGNALIGGLVSGVVAMQKLGRDRRTGLVATGRTAAELDRILPLIKLAPMFGGRTFADLDSALANLRSMPAPPEVRSRAAEEPESPPAQGPSPGDEPAEPAEVGLTHLRPTDLGIILGLLGGGFLVAGYALLGDWLRWPHSALEVGLLLLAAVWLLLCCAFIVLGITFLAYPWRRRARAGLTGSTTPPREQAWAYAFTCRASLEGMVQILSASGPWTWSLRDSHWYGDYISCRPLDGVRIRIGQRGAFLLPYVCQVEVSSQSSLSPGAVDGMVVALLRKLPARFLVEVFPFSHFD
jgi:hypothetical protein